MPPSSKDVDKDPSDYGGGLPTSVVGLDVKRRRETDSAAAFPDKTDSSTQPWMATLTFQSETTKRLAPAYIKPLVNPMMPSPRTSRPCPV